MCLSKALCYKQHSAYCTLSIFDESFKRTTSSERRATALAEVYSTFANAGKLRCIPTKTCRLMRTGRRHHLLKATKIDESTIRLGDDAEWAYVEQFLRSIR